MNALDREEKGLPTQTQAETEPSGYGSVNASNDPNKQEATAQNHPPHFQAVSHLLASRGVEESLIPQEHKLLVFRSLTGIDDVPIMKKQGFFSDRAAENVGIYTRVVKAEAAAKLKYRVFSLLINTCLAIQIIVAAALTALGAANGPHGAVTGFGAINTIMAGFLTYLKASGLPNSQKSAERRWGQVREYIEQREREFCLHDCPLNVGEEIREIESMYEDVRQMLQSDASEPHGSKGIEARRQHAGGFFATGGKIYSMAKDRMEGLEEAIAHHHHLPRSASVTVNLPQRDRASQTEPAPQKDEPAVGRRLSTMSGKTYE